MGNLELPSYIKDPETISRLSFECLQNEAKLDRFPADIGKIVARMVHATGLPELAELVDWRGDVAKNAKAAILQGGLILCDAEMVRAGMTRVEAGQIKCMLNLPGVTEQAKADGITRSAAGVNLWPSHLAGAVVVIGNAPTALFRLLEGLASGWPCPVAIFGLPVGFIGATESKRALMDANLDCPCLTVHGRMGGSAMASGAINALF